MSKATCRTCGATLPGKHVPSVLDPNGVGDPGHKYPGGFFQTIDQFPAPAPESMKMSVDNPEQKYTIEEVTMFLCGEAMLDGRWFGSIHKDRPVFWWRKHLRAAVDGYKAQASKDMAEVIGRNRECSDKDPKWYQKCCEYINKIKAMQRERAAAKGYKLEGE